MTFSITAPANPHATAPGGSLVFGLVFSCYKRKLDFSVHSHCTFISLTQVCSEEIMTEILTRYLVYNAHAASYTWKYNGTNLDMAKTLEDNGVKDEDEEFYELSIRDDQFLPAIHLYFNDDLTEA